MRYPRTQDGHRGALRFAGVLLLGVVCVVLFACGAWAYELTVELPGLIEAKDGAFHLGEYATFEGDRNLADSASMVVITPQDGVFTREDVIDALGSSAAAGRSVMLRMPDVVTVAPESPVAAELRAMTAWKWRIEAEGFPEDFISKESGYSLPPKVAPGARSVAVKLHEADGRRLNKQIKLRWYQPVVYLRKPMPKDAQIDAASLGTKIDTVGMTGTSVWAPEQLHGAVLRDSLGAGRPIVLGDVESAVLVRAGSSVTMVARVNGLGIEVRGIAMQRGSIGDTIKVKNLSSKKVLTGKIIDVGRVEIQ